jgi:hypothetical protein
MISLACRSHRHATIEDGLRSAEDRLVDEGLEVAPRAHGDLRTLDVADVDAVPQHAAERLR